MEMKYELHEGIIEVEYEIDGGEAGSACCPPTPPMAEFTKITYKGVDVMEIISQNDYDKIEAACFKKADEDYNDYINDKAESEYENRKYEQMYGEY